MLGFCVHAESKLSCLSSSFTEPGSHHRTSAAPLKTTSGMSGFLFFFIHQREMLKSGKHTSIELCGRISSVVGMYSSTQLS